MAVELCRVALWPETLDPGKPLSFLDHHVRVGNSLLGVPLATTVDRNRAAVEARRRKLQQQEQELTRELMALPPKDPAEGDLSKQLKKTLKDIEGCVYDSWADAVPDFAFKAVDPGEDTNRARAAVRANAKQRKTNQLRFALDNVLVELPADLVAEFERVGEGADDSVAEVTIRAEAFEGTQRRAEYQQLLRQAHTWTSTFFWPFTAGAPEPPTHETFITLKTNPASLPADVGERVRQEALDRAFFHPELAFPEVFTAQRGGFDLVLGNPPYLGGMKISSTFGAKVLHFLKSNHSAQTGGREDLAAYFVRRGFDMLRPDGDLCLITTNSIGEGDTRDAALVPITREWGGTLVDAVRSTRWKGEANVSVSVVHLHRGSWEGVRTVNGTPVAQINPGLGSREDIDPAQLTENDNLASAGTNIMGDGFQVQRDEYERLVAASASNARVLKLFYGGREVMSSPDLHPGRWVIDFGDLTEVEAAAFTDPFTRVRDVVKPVRLELDEKGNFKVKEKRLRDGWWKFGRPSANLYANIKHRGLTRVLVFPEVSKTMLPVRVDAERAVFSHKLVVIADDSDDMYGVLTSTVHRLWISRQCSTHETRPTYNPTPLTFPRPEPSADVAATMRKLEPLRLDNMKQRNIGVTDRYNLVDNPTCHDLDIVGIREMHVSLDVAVVQAYGWHDLAGRLGHGHHEIMKFGLRWTVSPDVHEDIHARLLALNLKRAAKESS